MNSYENKTNLNKSKIFDYDSIILNIKNNSYKYIGEGSGRRVYDLDDGYVAKVAKNSKGIAQNKVEYNIASKDNSDLFANIKSISDDYKVIIMKKAEKIERISYVFDYFHVKNHREFYHLKQIQDIHNKYKLVLKDFGRVSNWGQINGRPVIVDYGFTREIQRKYYFLL